MSQISLQNLKNLLGNKVIHDLSIDVKDGELIVIVGPSGMWKINVKNGSRFRRC